MVIAIAFWSGASAESARQSLRRHFRQEGVRRKLERVYAAQTRRPPLSYGVLPLAARTLDLKQREGFLLEFDERVFLPVAAQADAFLQVVES